MVDSLDVFASFWDQCVGKLETLKLSRVTLVWSTRDQLPVATISTDEPLHLFDVEKFIPAELQATLARKQPSRARTPAGEPGASAGQRAPASPRALAKKLAAKHLKHLLGPAPCGPDVCGESSDEDMELDEGLDESLEAALERILPDETDALDVGLAGEGAKDEGGDTPGDLKDEPPLPPPLECPPLDAAPGLPAGDAPAPVPPVEGAAPVPPAGAAAAPSVVAAGPADAGRAAAAAPRQCCDYNTYLLFIIMDSYVLLVTHGVQ